MLGFTRSTLRVKRQPTRLQDMVDDVISTKAARSASAKDGASLSSVFHNV